MHPAIAHLDALFTDVGIGLGETDFICMLTAHQCSPNLDRLGSEFGEISMDEVDRDRTFANGGRDPLHIPGANISHGEDSRQTGLEHLWWTTEPPCPIPPIKVASRQNETLVIQLQAPSEPLRSRRSSRHDE